MDKKTTSQILSLVKQALYSDHLSRGQLVKAVEIEFGRIFEEKLVTLTSSGTGGIHVALLALDLKPGDEVITTSFTFSASLNMILAVGAVPVLVDIDNNFKLDSSLIEKAISSKTKGILVADLFGMMHDYQTLRKLANKHKLWIVSDCCQSLGGKSQDQYPMAFCEFVIGSFFDSKNISSGEGGIVFTRNKQLYDRVNVLISHGQVRGKKYEYKEVGFNYRPSEVQAAILIPQIRNFFSLIKNKKRNAKLLKKKLKSLTGIILPEFNETDAYSSYPVLFGNKKVRDEVEAALMKAEIECKVMYPKSLHLYDCYKKVVKVPFPIVNASLLSNRILSLSLSYSNSQKIEKVHAVISKVLQKYD